MNLDADANGSPVRVIVASATTGICLLNSAVANGGVRHLKTGSLCRLIACISQVFQGRDASVHPNGENLNPDAGNDVASSIFSAPTRRPSFVELDSMWVYVTPCMGQRIFIALVCTPGYAHQNAEVILSIIADALLSAMKDPQLHRAVHNVCDESIAASDNYTANSSMSAQSTEPVTNRHLKSVDTHVVGPILNSYSGYDFGWCDALFLPLSNVSCFIFRFLPTTTQTSTKKINYRLIHRINVHSKHALCVNAHIQTIANSLLAGKESSLKNLKVEPVSFTSCPVHVCYAQLAPSPFALVAAVDQDILETSLSREKLDLIVHTCTTRVSNIYKNLSILNEVYAKPLNSNVEARKSTKQSDNRVRLIELSDRNASTSSQKHRVVVQPKPPPRHRGDQKEKSPKNVSIRVSRTTLKEISPEKVEKQIPGVVINLHSGSDVAIGNRQTDAGKSPEIKLMSSVGGSAVGSGARAVAQMNL